VRNPPPNSEPLSLGRSMGSGPTCELASRTDVGGVVLQSGFTSCVSVVQERGHINSLVDAFVNIKKIGKIAAPVLFIHGTQDSVVPFAHSKVTKRRLLR
jgi:fermentation-respiration switch protein FrsA (DUF1100 family)